VAVLPDVPYIGITLTLPIEIPGLRTGKQSLYLPRRSALELWRLGTSEPRLQLHQDTQ
jgi:hypothetical protein